MELTRKEEYRNKKISAGVTILSFLVMLAFLIFKNIITTNTQFATSIPNEMTIGISSGSDNNSNSERKKTIPLSEKKQQSIDEKIVTAPGKEIAVKSSAEILANKYKATVTKSSTETAGTENDLEGTTEKTNNIVKNKFNDSEIGFDLEKRSIIAAPVFKKDTKEEGKVIVEITVDQNGNVTEANPNGRGTTTSSTSLKAKAKQMALETKFNSNQKLAEQRGTITIIFSFN